MRVSVLLFLLMGVPLLAQETVVNIPSADITPANHLFVRSDSFYTQSPSYFVETGNFSYGLGHGLELSTNVTNLTHSASIFAVPGFKWAIKRGDFSFFVGDQIAVPMNTGEVGNTSYEAVAWSKERIRLTAGSFQSYDAVQAGNRMGALLGLEWTMKTFHDGWALTPQADWASGAGSNGYVSLALAFMKGSFFASPGYMIGNPHNLYGAHQYLFMTGYTF
jgi:hypothetical protein